MNNKIRDKYCAWLLKLSYSHHGVQGINTLDDMNWVGLVVIAVLYTVRRQSEWYGGRVIRRQSEWYGVLSGTEAEWVVRRLSDMESWVIRRLRCCVQVVESQMKFFISSQTLRLSEWRCEPLNSGQSVRVLFTITVQVSVQSRQVYSTSRC